MSATFSLLLGASWPDRTPLGRMTNPAAPVAAAVRNRRLETDTGGVGESPVFIPCS
jgi:hypothetical protein